MADKHLHDPLDYLYEELSPGDMAEARRHLSACPQCRAETRAVRETVKAYREAERPAPPPGLAARAAAAALEQARVKRTAPVESAPRPAAAPTPEAETRSMEEEFARLKEEVLRDIPRGWRTWLFHPAWTIAAGVMVLFALAIHESPRMRQAETRYVPIAASRDDAVSRRMRERERLPEVRHPELPETAALQEAAMLAEEPAPPAASAPVLAVQSASIPQPEAAAPAPESDAFLADASDTSDAGEEGKEQSALYAMRTQTSTPDPTIAKPEVALSGTADAIPETGVGDSARGLRGREAAPPLDGEPEPPPLLASAATDRRLRKDTVNSLRPLAPAPKRQLEPAPPAEAETAPAGATILTEVPDEWKSENDRSVADMAVADAPPAPPAASVAESVFETARLHDEKSALTRANAKPDSHASPSPPPHPVSVPSPIAAANGVALPVPVVNAEILSDPPSAGDAPSTAAEQAVQPIVVMDVFDIDNLPKLVERPTPVNVPERIQSLTVLIGMQISHGEFADARKSLALLEKYDTNAAKTMREMLEALEKTAGDAAASPPIVSEPVPEESLPSESTPPGEAGAATPLPYAKYLEPVEPPEDPPMSPVRVPIPAPDRADADATPKAAGAIAEPAAPTPSVPYIDHDFDMVPAEPASDAEDVAEFSPVRRGRESAYVDTPVAPGSASGEEEGMPDSPAVSAPLVQQMPQPGIIYIPVEPQRPQGLFRGMRERRERPFTTDPYIRGY